MTENEKLMTELQLRWALDSITESLEKFKGKVMYFLIHSGAFIAKNAVNYYSPVVDNWCFTDFTSAFEGMKTVAENILNDEGSLERRLLDEHIQDYSTHLTFINSEGRKEIISRLELNIPALLATTAFTAANNWALFSLQIIAICIDTPPTDVLYTPDGYLN